MRKKLIITEDEKKQILGLYEAIGDQLTPEQTSSLKGNYTKNIAHVLNAIYGINLSTYQTGNWADKDYNDYLKKFMEENDVPVWICKKGDGYCSDTDEGEVTTKDMDRLKDAFIHKLNELNKPNLSNQINSLYNSPTETTQNKEEIKSGTGNDPWKYKKVTKTDGTIDYYGSRDGGKTWVITKKNSKSYNAIKTNIFGDK